MPQAAADQVGCSMHGFSNLFSRVLVDDGGWGGPQTLGCADLNDSGGQPMKVRTKTWLSATIGLAAFSIGGAAGAQCGSVCAHPPAPPPPPPPPSACCSPPPAPDFPAGGFGGGNFNLNVNINGNSNSNSNSNFNSASSLLRGRGGGDVFVSGGGGGAFFNVEQPYPTVIQGINVEGAAMAQLIQVPVTMARLAASRVVIRAVCIDDRNIPHPAAQVQPGREVAEGYEGEIYRCIAGSRLQVTYADFLNEDINFDRGQTLICAKGESLWYRRGHASTGATQAAAFSADQYGQMYAEAYAELYAQQGGMGGPVTVRTEGGESYSGGGMAIGGGEMICAAQRPERDCNERSLLRRYGAGVKILTLWREEYYTEYHEQIVQAESSVSFSSSLTLDGGVGGRVF
jgi:hypothetical protein